jgi:acyl transferase domain-containing protein/alpha-ketoglutarate-dependent taurine dioxygenase
VNSEDIFEADDSCDIAIVSMAGRFPKAKNVDAFWENLRSGVEGISFFSDDELEIENLTPEDLKNPNFIRAKAILEDIELFDASFFNMPAREAEWMDPQQRLLLEIAWEALESAGYDLSTYEGLIAVYAGVGANTYIMSRQLNLENPGDLFQIVLSNDKDHLATRVSYKLNLRGESITVQTACSTSLVATHLACQSLLSGQSDMALAGGVTIHVPQKTGYLYQEGMILSPDGHCRPFDRKAHGTVDGSGAAVVVLKRLADAIRDGDQVYAIIKGSAINNDGHLKAGYTAPSVEGQYDVIGKALAIAGVEAESIGYVEAHGTGTPLGDPIEVEALSRVFGRQTQRKGFCALGSVKSNIGHLDTAAGVTGLIKAALSLKHKQIPPTLHFEKPNQRINFNDTPFFVNNSLVEWKNGSGPRRAGVSAFGIGGTNVHLIMEEAPERQPSGEARPCQLITLSAKTDAALESSSRLLADYLEARPEANLADAAYTRNAGRQSFSHRAFVVVRNPEDAINSLRKLQANRNDPAAKAARGAVFMFPGQGVQSVNMARELYVAEPAFRQSMNDCASSIKETLGHNLLDVIYPPAGMTEEAERLIAQPAFTLPALFAVEYSLAQLLINWGLRPSAMIGHSFGEYAAACLAGVFSLDDALKLAAIRGRLIERLPEGAMVAAKLSEAEAREFATGGLSIAGINSKVSCVISGPAPDIESLEATLREKRIGHRRLEVRRAFHSAMLDPILPALIDEVAKLKLSAPQIPYISSLTGKWIKTEEATDPRYWAEQMRQAVRFADGLDRLAEENHSLFIEVGPEHGLCALANQHYGRASGKVVAPSLKKSETIDSDCSILLEALGAAWTAGLAINWSKFYENEKRHRIALPTYPFERRRYWVEARTGMQSANGKIDSQPFAASAPVASSSEPQVEIAAQTSKHEVERSGLQTDYREPRNAVEKELARIWSDALGLEQIGIHDGFYDLGGDSLLATQIYARVQQTISPDITLKQVLSHLTIAEFAEAIAAQADDPAAKTSDWLAIRPAPRDEHIPLSFAQQRLWFIDQTEPGSSLYNLSTAVRLTGELNIAALNQSFNEIFRRHESLRTTFTTFQDRPVQSIAPALEINLDVADFSAHPEQQREAEAQQAIKEEALLPFDLAAGPLMRFKLLRLSAQDHILIITAHHIVSDGWSIGVLMNELSTLYDAFSNARPSPLAELAIQYPDFARWQREQIREEVLEAQLAYWKRQLGGDLPALELPFARPRPQAQSFQGARQSFAISASVTDSLKQLSRAETATLYMTLLAAFQTLLHRYTGQQSVVVGSPVAGRRQPEVEALIGVFINMLALRTDFSGDPQFKELLGRVRKLTLEAYANQDVPFEKLVDAIQPERTLSHAPLFQALFNFQNMPLRPVEVSGLTLAPMEIENDSARFDLSLNIADTADGLAGQLEYNTDIFGAADIKRMLGHFETLLASIAANPGARLSALEIMTEAERQEAMQEERERESAQRQMLKKVRRKAVTLSQQALVKTGHLNGDTLPLVITPEVEGVDLNGWAANNRDFIEAQLLKHGAILFRGFRVKDATEFRQLAITMSSDLLEYRYRSTPRTEIGDRVYTSTEYPADQVIPMHNENAYSKSWPMKLWFYCALAAQQGGETPVADSRRVFELIDPRIKERFIAKGVMYVRNYGEGFDLSWQEVFQTEDKSEVEQFCRRSGIDFEWRSGDRLRTRQVCRAVARHPKTKEMVWFNQAHLFHTSSLDSLVRASLLASFNEDELPRNACYGDRAPIEDATLDAIREVYRQTQVSFSWAETDILMIDNMLVAHGRKPYVGPRKILVTMAESCAPNGNGF